MKLDHKHSKVTAGFFGKIIVCPKKGEKGQKWPKNDKEGLNK